MYRGFRGHLLGWVALGSLWKRAVHRLRARLSGGDYLHLPHRVQLQQHLQQQRQRQRQQSQRQGGF